MSVAASQEAWGRPGACSWHLPTRSPRSTVVLPHSYGPIQMAPGLQGRQSSPSPILRENLEQELPSSPLCYIPASSTQTPTLEPTRQLSLVGPKPCRAGKDGPGDERGEAWAGVLGRSCQGQGIDEEELHMSKTEQGTRRAERNDSASHLISNMQIICKYHPLCLEDHKACAFGKWLAKGPSGSVSDTLDMEHPGLAERTECGHLPLA